MSLLMDTLKKAEQTKTDTAEQMPAPSVAIVEPIKAESGTADNDQVELSLDEIEPLKPAFLDAPEATPTEPLALNMATQNDAVKEESIPPTPTTIKSPPTTTPTLPTQESITTEPAPPSPAAAIIPSLASKKKINRSYLWGGLIVLMAIAGFAYYFVIVLAPSSQLNSAPPPLIDWQADDAPITAEQPLVVPTPAVEAKAVAKVSAPTPVPEASKQQLSAPVVTAVKAKPTSRPAPISAPIKDEAIAPIPEQQAPPQQTLSIQRNQTEDPLQKLLQQAYANYQSGDLDHADNQYRLALRLDNQHHDALLGRAIIAQRQNRTADARRFYDHLLRLNPKDSVALTGLMSLPQQGVSAHNVSQLKMLLADEPNAAHLHFALGNEYAGQTRWPAAQQAYFNAHRHAPNNGDYAFNLAVSLERIGQPQSALSYYRRALESKQQRVAFDRQQLRQHIERLSQQATPQ